MPYTYDYPRPALGVDALVFAKEAGGLKILLILRKNEPFKEMWAFPGGFMDMDELIENAVYRELEEETGLSGVTLKRLDVFDGIHRDPRGRVLTVAYVGVVDKALPVQGLDDAAEARWFDVASLPALAFDHDLILLRALKTI